MSKDGKLTDMKLDLLLFINRFLEFQHSYNVADKQYFDLLQLLLENVMSFIDNSRLIPLAQNSAYIEVIAKELKSGECAMCGENFKLPVQLFEQHLEMIRHSRHTNCSATVNPKRVENGVNKTLANHPILTIFPVQPMAVIDINSSASKPPNKSTSTVAPNKNFTLPVLKMIKSQNPNKSKTKTNFSAAQMEPLSMSRLLNQINIIHGNLNSTVNGNKTNETITDDYSTDDSYATFVDQCSSTRSSRNTNSNHEIYASDISLSSSCDVNNDSLIANEQYSIIQKNNPFKMPLPSEVIGFRQTFPIHD